LRLYGYSNYWWNDWWSYNCIDYLLYKIRKVNRKLNCHAYVPPTTTTPKPYPLSTNNQQPIALPTITTTTTRATPREATTPPRPRQTPLQAKLVARIRNIYISLEVSYTYI